MYNSFRKKHWKEKIESPFQSSFFFDAIGGFGQGGKENCDSFTTLRLGAMKMDQFPLK